MAHEVAAHLAAPHWAILQSGVEIVEAGPGIIEERLSYDDLVTNALNKGIRHDDGTDLLGEAPLGCWNVSGPSAIMDAT
jgi:hypothetical protein